MEEYIWKLMSRSLFGEATVEELQELQEILKKDPSLQQHYQLIHQLFDTQPKFQEGQAIDYEEDARLLMERAEKMKLQGRANLSVPGKRRLKFWIAAASLIGLLAIGGLYFYQSGSRGERGRLLIRTENGERRKIVLSDGTQVWMNAGSKLYYLTNFKGQTREVKLQGEAFFDVAKDSSKPFIVHAGTIRVKVLGTAFNIKAYEEDKNVTTSLYRGLVSVSREGDEGAVQPIQLNPYQKLIIPKKQSSDTESGVANAEPLPAKVEFLDSTQQEPERLETSWIYERLEFRGDDFVTLAYKLEHWYNVAIEFEDDNVKKLKFNGSFGKETITQALEALQTAHPFTFKIKDNAIFISSHP